jgi:hypothetical protein
MYLTSLPKGFTKGRIRTLIQAKVRPSVQQYSGAGISCLQAHVGICSVASTFYSFRLSPGSGATGSPGTLHWVLGKNVAQKLVVSPTVIDESHTETVVDGDYWPVQLEWVADVPNLGGTRLTASVGTKNSTDFTTLATLIDYLDTSSPLTTSVAEGIFDAYPGAGAGAHTFVMDETTIYELT